MGLRNLDKVEADSQKKARTEEERAVKKSAVKSSKSQVKETKPITVVRRRSSEGTMREKNSSQKEGSKVRVIEEGALKRKGETLVSDIPKQTRRSRRVRTIRQQEEKQSIEVSSTIDELSLVTVNPVFEEISQETTTPTVVQMEEPTEHSEEKINSFPRLRKEDLEIKVFEEIEPVKKRSNFIIIKDIPRKIVTAQFKPILVNENTMHLLNEGEKSFYEQLKIIGKTPYPTQMPNKPHTIFSILEDTEIKVVPDIQPRRPIQGTNDKGKKKLYPEPAMDVVTEEEIADEVCLIEEACDLKRKANAMCIYQNPGTSGSRSTTNDPVGGTLIEGHFNPIKVADMECLIEHIVKAILRQRPLWHITSAEEVLPFLGGPAPRLPVPDDLAFEEEQPQEADQPKPALDLEARVAQLEKEVEECKKMLKQLKQHFGL